MLRHEIKATPHPLAQRLVAGEPRTSNVHHADHRAAGEIKRSDMRLSQDIVPPFGAYLDDQIGLEHPAAHLAVDHERNAAEHLLFLNRRYFGQRRAKAGG